MIRTLYRRPDAPTDPAEAFAPVDVLDPLAGVLPVHLLEECGEPEWLAVVALLGDPHAVRVDVEVVEVSESSRLDEEFDPDDATTYPCARGEDCGCDPQSTCPGWDAVVVEGPPTLALVPPVVDEVDVVECPDCGATGPDPCRPKSNPAAGKPLTRQHRRRRELLEREAGRGGVLLLVVVVLVVAAVASGVAATLRTAVDSVRPACVVPTASGCEVGP